MGKCTKLLDIADVSLVDNPTVKLPFICLSFEIPEEPLECPIVVVTLIEWTVSGVYIRANIILDKPTRCGTRWRTNNEAATDPGAWSTWLIASQAYVLSSDVIIATGLTAGNWYDVQWLLEPEGYDGWTEIWPACGGYWHLQTSKKGSPAPLPPYVIGSD